MTLPEHNKYMYLPCMCISVCGFVGGYMRVCVGEGVYIKQIIIYYVLAVEEIHQLGYGPVNEGHVVNLIVKSAAEGAHHFLLTPKVGG